MIQVKHETTANSVRRLDEMETPKGRRIVSEVDMKVKWVYFTFSDGTKAEMRLNDPVTVYRFEKTEEEKKADTLDYVLRNLRERLSKGLRDRASDLVLTALERKQEKGYDLFTWSSLPDMLRAEADQRLFRQIDHARATMVERGVSEDDALIAAFYRLDEYAARRYMQDPLSRSTSTLSNLLEDLDTYALVDLKRDLQWVLTQEIGQEISDRVLAYLKARAEAEKQAS